MVANADEIREYVVENYIKPRLRDGRLSTEVYLNEVANGVRREGERPPFYQAIKAALTTRAFQNRLNITATENAYTSIVFTLRNMEGQPFDLPISAPEAKPTASPPPETESKEDIIAKLTERIDELTQDEFKILVRAYAQANGFSNVELSFVLKFNE